jgi:hypothetical protein
MTTTTDTARYECTRCFGLGRLMHYSHVQGGVCFACSGTGIVASQPTKRASSTLTTQTYRASGRANVILLYHVVDGRHVVTAGDADETIDTIDCDSIEAARIEWTRMRDDLVADGYRRYDR